jgi:hypothetical protein
LDQGAHVFGRIRALPHTHQNKKKKGNKQTKTHLNIIILKNRFAIKNNQFA